MGEIQIEQLDSLSSTEIRLKTPPSPSGHKDIRVVNPDGQQAVQTRAFTYNAPLSITSITPNVGPMKGGTPVTIVGAGFRVGDWSTRITIGGVLVSAITGHVIDRTDSQDAGGIEPRREGCCRKEP